jgi:hypothetical protein
MAAWPVEDEKSFASPCRSRASEGSLERFVNPGETGQDSRAIEGSSR